MYHYTQYPVLTHPAVTNVEEYIQGLVSSDPAYTGAENYIQYPVSSGPASTGAEVFIQYPVSTNPPLTATRIYDQYPLLSIPPLTDEGDHTQYPILTNPALTDEMDYTQYSILTNPALTDERNYTQYPMLTNPALTDEGGCIQNPVLANPALMKEADHIDGDHITYPSLTNLALTDIGGVIDEKATSQKTATPHSSRIESKANRSMLDSSSGYTVIPSTTRSKNPFIATAVVHVGRHIRLKCIICGQLSETRAIDVRPQFCTMSPESGKYIARKKSCRSVICQKPAAYGKYRSARRHMIPVDSDICWVLDHRLYDLAITPLIMR